MSAHSSMPSLYIPHGGGPAFFMQGPMRDMFRPVEHFLAGLASQLPATPRAIVVISAHWEAELPTVATNPAPELLYDYYGFPPETYAITYPAAPAPALAQEVISLLQAAGIRTHTDAQRGWDHGVFIPLKVMFAQAQIPLCAISLQANLDPQAHIDLGEALRPLRAQGVLIVGSGSSYHNLRHFAQAASAPASQAFDAWLDQALAGNAQHRRSQLTQWASAPCARASHPREEHLLPLMVASGAGSDQPAQKLWTGNLGGTQLSAWAFD